MTQLTHDRTLFTEKKFPIVLVLDSITGPANVGSIFRLADAFNVEQVILCGNTFSDLSSSRLKRTARSTLQVVDHLQEETSETCCHRLSSEGYTLFALEITENSRPVHSRTFEGISKMALVVGNEQEGISKEVLQMAEASLHIEMFGKNSSMNVAQASGIALFEITKSLQPV